MSDTETIKGKLIPFNKGIDESLYAYFKRFFEYKEKEFGLSENASTEEIYEEFYDEFYKSAIINEDVIYDVVEKQFRPNYDEDIFELFDNNDGTFNFVVRYYNGGCSFSEAIEQAFEYWQKNNSKSFKDLFNHFEYDDHGQMIFAVNGNKQQLAFNVEDACLSVRGWGNLEKMFGQKDGERFQDAFGRWVVKTLNEKLKSMTQS